MLTPFQVVHLFDEHEVACWLRTLDHWLEKPWDKHKALQVFDRSREGAAMPHSDPIEAQIARTAASIPAIDFVRGWALARSYDSIIDLFSASREDLMRVKGIGPVIAKSFYNSVRRKK
jgi:DNA integrity scanning protein DisA with diadenylate cyclase activity